MYLYKYVVVVSCVVVMIYLCIVWEKMRVGDFVLVFCCVVRLFNGSLCWLQMLGCVLSCVVCVCVCGCCGCV